MGTLLCALAVTAGIVGGAVGGSLYTKGRALYHRLKEKRTKKSDDDPTVIVGEVVEEEK